MKEDDTDIGFIVECGHIYFPHSKYKECFKHSAFLNVPWKEIIDDVDSSVGAELTIEVLHNGAGHLPPEIDIDMYLDGVYEHALRIENWEFGTQARSLSDATYELRSIVLKASGGPLAIIKIPTSVSRAMYLKRNELMENIIGYLKSKR